MKVHWLALLTVVLGISGATPAKASEGEWKRVSAYESALATTPSAIQKLLTENPEILGYNSGSFFQDAAAILSGASPGKLLELRVKRRTYVWEGTTVCSEGDRRLTRQVVFVSAYRFSNDPIAMSGSGEVGLLPRDPCTF